MLANGSHVGILLPGSSTPISFMLDEAAQAQLAAHSGSSLLANRQQGAGLPGRQNLLSHILPYAFEDFSGGENAKFYNPQEPAQYDYGSSGNTRIPKMVKGTPTRTDSTALTPTTIIQAFLVNSQGKAWALCGDVCAYNGDPTSTTWTAGPAIAGRNLQILSAVGDKDWVYYGQLDSGPTESKIRRVSTTTSQPVTNIFSGTFTYVGMAIFGPYLYYMRETGSVRRVDITPDPLTPVNNPDPFYSITSTTAGYGGMVSSDTGVLLFSANDGQTTVHEVTGAQTANPVGRPIWTLDGFTGTALGFAHGVIYLAGYYGDTSGTSRAFLWGMSNTQRDPRPIGYFRSDNSLTANLVPQSLTTGPGAQVLIGMKSGEMFVYDQEQDAISLLDTRTGVGNLGAVRTYKGARMALFLDTGATAVKASAWKDDWSSTKNGSVTYLPAWSFLLPEYEKILLGYHLTFKPIPASGDGSDATIIVSWQLDESGSYTAATTIDKNTSGAQTGRATVQISDGTNSRKFRQLRTKLETTSVALGTATEVYAISAIAEIADYLDERTFAFKIQDEDKGARPSNSQVTGSQKLDLIFNSTTGLLPTKNIVTLVDGTVSPVDGTTSSSTVRVSDAKWVLKRLGKNAGRGYLEGTLFVTFRSAAA